jgi:hypothetical protein
MSQILMDSPVLVSGAQYTTISVTYNWYGYPMAKSYAPFVHVIDATGNIVIGPQFSLPVDTTVWSGPVTTTQPMNIPAALPVGDYRIVAGLFDLADWSIAARPSLSVGPGVIDQGYKEYVVGTLRVTAGNSLPRTPVVPAPIGGPGGSVPNAGDPITQSSYSDDFHPAGYTVSFHDEFSSFNSAIWQRQLAWGDRSIDSNSEAECYLEDNVTVSGGILTLTAKQDPVICPKSNLVKPYTSGEINSMNSFSQQYGYFAIRAKLPSGAGTWPAFWLMPMDASWPPEIDIFEFIGDPTKIVTTYHWLDGNNQHQMDGTGSTIADSSADYHVYAIDWTPGSLKWMVDGQVIHTHTGADVTSKAMYIIANLAVGGNGSWPGAPNAATVFPSQYMIDWIRAYKTP